MARRPEQPQATNPEKTTKCSQPGGSVLTGERDAREDIRGRFKKYIVGNFMSPGEEESLMDDASLLEEGIMDSTGVLDLVMFIEETFGIVVKDEELIPENLDSVNKLVAFVERKTGRAA
jgi:acyl carrier protein